MVGSSDHCLIAADYGSQPFLSFLVVWSLGGVPVIGSGWKWHVFLSSQQQTVMAHCSATKETFPSLGKNGPSDDAVACRRDG